MKENLTICGRFPVIIGAVALVALMMTVAPAEALTARATVDRNQVAPGETITLQVLMSDGSGEVDTSSIVDFDVVYRGQSSSIQIINGDVRREFARTYSLFPKHSGKLIVPALSVRSGGEQVRTSPIVVQVAREAAGEAGGDIALTAQLSASTAWVGQEIVYTFRFMAAVAVSNARYQRPSFEGFEVTDLDGQKEYETVQNGRRFSVTEVSYLLTPTVPGRLKIDPGRITCDVRDRRGRGSSRSLLDDPFFNRFRTVSRTVQSEAVTVEVRKLPEKGRPANYSGLVGSFSLAATVSEKKVKAGDSVTVSATLEGNGNLSDMAVPEFRGAGKFKVYPDDPEESVVRDAGGTRGRKVFRFAVVSLAEGNLQIDSFVLPVFNPAKGDYEILRSDPIVLAVLPGDDNPAPVASGDTSGEDGFRPRKKRKVARTGQDILGVRSEWSVLESRTPLGPGVFLLLLVLPPLAHGGQRLFLARRRRPLTERDRMKERAAGMLAEAKKLTRKEDVRLLGPLERALVFAIFCRMGRTGESLTYDEAELGLAGTGMERDRIDEILTTLRAVEAARYGGKSDATSLLVERVEALVEELC